MSDLDNETRGERMLRRAAEVSDKLVGTTKSISLFASNEEQKDPDFSAYLDDRVFLCNSCDWWCDVCEREGDDGKSWCEDCWSYNKPEEGVPDQPLN